MRPVARQHHESSATPGVQSETPPIGSQCCIEAARTVGSLSHDRSAIRLPIFGQRAIDMRIRELTDDPDFGTFMYEEERRMFRMRDAAPWVFGPLGEFIDTWEDPHRISIDEVWTLFAHFVGLDKNGNPTGCGGVCRYCEDQCDSGVRKNAREAFDVFGLIEQKFIHRRLNSSGIRVRYKDLPHKCHLDLDSVSMPDTPGIYFLLADPENVRSACRRNQSGTE